MINYLKELGVDGSSRSLYKTNDRGLLGNVLQIHSIVLFQEYKIILLSYLILINLNSWFCETLDYIKHFKLRYNIIYLKGIDVGGGSSWNISQNLKGIIWERSKKFKKIQDKRNSIYLGQLVHYQEYRLIL